MNDKEKSIYDEGECRSRRVTLKQWKSMSNKNRGNNSVTKPRRSVESISRNVSKNVTEKVEEKPAKHKSRPSLSRIQELSKPSKSALLHTWKTYSNVFDYDRMKKLMNKLNVEFALTQEEKNSCMEHLRKNVISCCGKKAMGSREIGKKYHLNNDDIQRITGISKSQKGARWSRRIEELARPKACKVLATWDDYGGVLPVEKRVNFHRKYVESVEEIKRTQEEQEFRNSQRGHIQHFESSRSSSSMMEEQDRMMARAAAYKLVEKGVERALLYAEEGRPPPLMSRTLLKLSDNILAVLSDRNLIKMPTRSSQEKNAKFLMYVSDWTAKIISDAYLATEKAETGQKVFTKKYIKSTSDKGIQETILEQDEDSPHECKEENSKEKEKKSEEISEKPFEDISEIDNSFGNESDWDEETGTLKDQGNHEIKKLSITRSNTKIIHIRKDNDQSVKSQKGGEKNNVGDKKIDKSYKKDVNKTQEDNNQFSKIDTDKKVEESTKKEDEGRPEPQKMDVGIKLSESTHSSKTESEQACKIVLEEISQSSKSEKRTNDKVISTGDEVNSDKKPEENVQSSKIEGDSNDEANSDSPNINGNKNLDEDVQPPQMDGDKNDKGKSLCCKIDGNEIHKENIESCKVDEDKNQEENSESYQTELDQSHDDIIESYKIDSHETTEDYSDTYKTEDEDNLQDNYQPCKFLECILTKVNIDGKDLN
ncbi:transcriptional regulator ATRX homolog [Onthophagus taurus]|uniref:transcriptional regulator ATRX homolog n=1 Tax=Onthophagus taurus TaxID=166361 RepID=UPI0039BDE698